MIIIANSIFNGSETTEQKLHKHTDFSCTSLRSPCNFVIYGPFFKKNPKAYKCRNPWLYKMDGCAPK